MAFSPVSRVGRGGFPDRQFDVDFWQAQGDEAIFDAAREMVVIAGEFTGSIVELKPDIKDLLRSLNQSRVRYLIVGGYEVMKYTEPFYTKDIDVWIEASEENGRRAYQALAQFGAPMADLVMEDLKRPNVVFQFGMAPARVDVMTSMDGVTFNEAWDRRVETGWGDTPVKVISFDHLIRNKEAANRDSDRLHLERLRKYGTS